VYSLGDSRARVAEFEAQLGYGPVAIQELRLHPKCKIFLLCEGRHVFFVDTSPHQWTCCVNRKCQQNGLLSEESVRLLDLRQRSGLSQAEMAQRLGITRQYYNAMECGHRAPGKLLLKSLDSLESELTVLGRKKVNGVDTSASGTDAQPQVVSEGSRLPIAGRSEILAYMEPWLQKIAEDENVAPYILTQLRKHLPHDDMGLFGKK